MKKLILVSIACVAFALSFVSCQKDKLSGGSFTATIAQFHDSSKVTYNGTSFAWQSGDSIVVFRLDAGSETHRSRGCYTAALNGEQTSTATFTFVPNVYSNDNDVTDNSLYQGPFHAISPYAIAPHRDSWTFYNRVKLPASQTVDANGNLIGFPMYAETEGRNLHFKNLCGLLKLHLKKAGSSIASVVISTEDGALNGLFDINRSYDANGKLTGASLTQTEAMTDARKTVGIQFNTPQSIAQGRDFYIYLPARDYQTLTIVMTDANGDVCTKSLNSTHTFHVASSQWSRITLEDDDLVFESVSTDIAGSKGGLFSVAVGKQVVFSQGNLQYNPSQETWRFATNQYDQTPRVRSTDYSSEYSSTYDGWIDLFRWATSGYDEGPCASSTTASDYGPVNGRYGYPITGDYAEYDWGVHNAITNGGNQAGLWRTMTKDEWTYLLDTRANAANRRAKATVCEVTGLILLPDSWTQPSGVSMTTNNGSYTTSTNIYDAATWVVLEQAGAVFLPVSGYLNNSYSGTSVTYGQYWTATNSSTTQAYYLSFKGSSQSANSAMSRTNCLAVRLVHDID